jgi:Flp pilus assembly protein TadG
MRSESGQALVETAIILPVLLILVFGIINFATVWNHWESLTDAVRASGRAAATCRFGGDYQAAFMAAAGDLPEKRVTATGCGAPGTKITVTGKQSFDINIMGLVVKSGDLTSTVEETVE